MSPRNPVRRGPRPVGDRLRRLLVVLPWLAERGSATLAEMSERFQLSEAELVKDLEQAAMCGLPPYLDEVIDLFIDDDGTVHLGVPRFFTAPLRLTAPEGFALLAAGRLAMALPGADPAGPLGRALTKLQAVLGDDSIVVDVPQPPATADLAAAAAAGERVEITYWSASSDATTTRTITPRLVFTDRGEWYVRADDDRSGEQRHFRIDRIASWRRTGEHAGSTARTPEQTGTWFDDDPDVPTATLRLAPGTAWAVDRVPVRSLERDADGSARVELAVVDPRWLADLLVRIGPAASVESPTEWADLGARRAAELLAARYGETG